MIPAFETSLPIGEASTETPGIRRMWVDSISPSGTVGSGETYAICRYAPSASGYVGTKLLVRTFSAVAVNDPVIVAISLNAVGTFNSQPVNALVVTGGGSFVRAIRHVSGQGIEVTYDGTTWVRQINTTNCPANAARTTFSMPVVGDEDGFTEGGAESNMAYGEMNCPADSVADGVSADDGSGSASVFTAPASPAKGAAVYAIKFIALGPTPKTLIRLFRKKSGGDLIEFDQVEVPKTEGGKVEKKWNFTWVYEDETNGMVLEPEEEIYLGVYDSGVAINAIFNGVNIV